MLNKSEAGFRKLIELLKPHHRKIIWGFVFMLVYVVCWPLLAWLAGQLIPAIGKGDLSKVLVVITQALCVFLVQKLAQFFQDILLADPSLRISQDLRQNLFSKLQKTKLEAVEKLSTGDLTYRLTEDADRVGEVIYKTIQDTTPCALQLVAVYGYMVYLDWQLSISTLFLAPIVAVLVSKFGAKVMIAAEKSQNQVSELAGLLGEAIQGLPLVRAFAAEEWLQQRFNQQVELHRKARYQNLRLLALQHPVIGFIEASGILTVLALGAARIQSGGLDSKGFSSYVAALLMLIDPISHLTTNFNEFKQGQASLRRLKAIENEPLEIEDEIDAIKLKNPKGDILFESVEFSYDNKNKVINNLSLTISGGQIVALVGPSGAGKSTLFSLILRFNKPQKGNIYFDKFPIENLKSSELRTQIAIVPQTVVVFSGTIYESICFGRVATKKDVIKSATIANAHDFIMEFPNGYETRLEERGVNLSGGQLQRIAIARAVLGNPSVLLLDEATSALDSEAEASVQLGIKQAMKGRTVVVIAHRLSTVQEADQIIVLEKGTIVDKGTHDDLINMKGRYRELCEKQFIRNADP